MMRMALMVIGVFLGESAAVAGTCNIQSSSPPGVWRFFRVYDGGSGEVLLRQAISGGDSKSVTSKSDQVRVEFKLPGHTKYQVGATATCKDGNTIRS